MRKAEDQMSFDQWPTSGKSPASAILGYPITHYSYSVRDIPESVEFWTSVVGAGPFYMFENIKFDYAEHQGEPCVFEHSTALGWWGSITIELEQMDELRPESLANALAPRTPGLNHVSSISPDMEADSKRLEEYGLPQVLRAKTMEFDLVFHQVPLLGHCIELYQENAFVHEFFAALARAADDWDGEDPLREGPPPL